MKKLLVISIVLANLSVLVARSWAYQSAQNLQRYMMANYYQFGNDTKNAGHWYSQITPTDDSLYVYLGYIPYLSATQSYAEIIKLIPQLDEKFKSNQAIQLVFADALEKSGNKKDAYNRLILLNEQNKTDQELAFKVAQLYLERSEPENALKVIDNLLNTSARRPNNYIFLFLKSQIYLQLNKKDQALASIKQCIEMYPKFDKSWLLYAVLHEQQGKIEEAIKGYTTFLEVTTDANSEIQRHLLALTFKQKMLAKQSPALAADDTQNRLLKIQSLISMQQFDQAVALLSDWIIHDKESELWPQTLHLLTYLGLPYKKALHALQAIEKQKGKSLERALYQADLALRDADQKQALQELNKAYALAQDATLKTKIAYQIGIIYYDQQKWELAQKQLEQALTLEIEYPPLNNLLAYLYATKTNDLNRATQQLNHALAKDPENPHFIDTKAIILYKQNKYDEAAELLQKVAQICPTDFTVLCHLGKCYLKQGKTSQALDSMKSAVQVAKNEYEKKKAETLIAQWSK